MTNNEKRLLKILAATFFFASIGGIIYTGFDRIARAEKSIDSYVKAQSKLPQIESDQNEIDARIAQIKEAIAKLPVSSDRVPFSDFATEVRTLLSRYRLDPTQYQIVGSGTDEALEFSLRGETASFLRFLKDASNEKRGWDIPYLSIRPILAGNDSEITVRIKHAQ